ncbi:DDHD-domain-containing protein [Glonium stellatum]|uniref:DDHD-domain-containing protein n=1 Tax=Glonium stellatum TaxID=574774 RepID=A0A8E2FBT8_9PEZI|nr:DDHD-domain-containing protein [Glonium stellatum]
MSTPENKSYLAAGISAFSPWGSRASTPRQPGFEGDELPPEGSLGSQRGGDHTINRTHRLSLRSYPRDCPPLAIPKRKPSPSGQELPPSDKPVPAPKKWFPFSSGDSRAIEVAFQKLADEAETAELRQFKAQNTVGNHGPDALEEPTVDSKNKVGRTKVPVNEDFLFDVDIEERELAPAYWPGPVYEVRRGTWFYQDGSTLRPCDENLATQLEEGYLKVKPWRLAQQDKRSASQPRSRPTSLRAGEDLRKAVSQSISNPITPKSSFENLRVDTTSSSEDAPAEHVNNVSPPQDQPSTHRLFGAHMNSVVTYQNATTAWILTDDFLSRMSSTVYQRFAGGGHFAGVKLIRGYTDSSKKLEEKDEDRPVTSGSPSSNEEDDAVEAKVDRTSRMPPKAEDDNDEKTQSPSEIRRQTLERQMSNLVASFHAEDPEKQEEEIRKRDEKEIRDDYKEQTGEEQGREIEHLLLTTHGIGQRLGMRIESINFVHDVNTLRKTMKAVYANSTDLQALNSEVDKEPKNCRIQALPICWRHKLDFPKQSLKHNRKEQDLGDLDSGDQEYPNLDDITIEGVPAVRNLITDLALDILLYQSPAYKEHISRIVVEECNRIYRLFKERNPSFNGKVSLVGHSLGSAIMFDILCRQEDETAEKHRGKNRRATNDGLKLDFEVEDFYALGSPIGLFQMLKGHTIVGRTSAHSVSPKKPSTGLDDSFLSPSGQGKTSVNRVEIATSSPKCKQVYNIFHPTDPISYRIEPLISSAMSSLKPQPLPYTKKGIFGAPVGQGLTGIGVRVGQSVSGLWSSLSSGIASSILNRSLGITGEDATKLGTNPVQQFRGPTPVGAGTNVGGGVVPGSAVGPDIAATNEVRKRKLGEEPITTGDIGEHPPTLLDSELQTLYSGFHQRRKSHESEGDKDLREKAKWLELEKKGRKLKKEESKVRALNSNGRVDYSIQEGAFDISLIASIASHLSYWSDEDVSHFITSQLLSRHRVFKRTEGAHDIRI